jgi:SAM-dependent methyltransferase
MSDGPGGREDDVTTHPGDDEWEAHWEAFGAAAEDNPANRYRHRLIFNRLGPVYAGDCLLDIGSGQGEFAVLAAERYPDLIIRGIEYSATGVALARVRAAQHHVAATFGQRDLLTRTELDSGERAWADVAVCSEVLEHVDEPTTLLRHALDYLKPGCRLVVTVPGGPRSAFDRHIGHRRHFDAGRLRRLLADAGLERINIERAGFPFFNLYRLSVMMGGRRLIDDFRPSASSTVKQPSRKTLQQWAARCFDFFFRWNIGDTPFGWQLVATAYLRPESESVRSRRTCPEPGGPV